MRQRWSNAGTPDNILAERAYDELGRIAFATQDDRVTERGLPDAYLCCGGRSEPMVLDVYVYAPEIDHLVLVDVMQDFNIDTRIFYDSSDRRLSLEEARESAQRLGPVTFYLHRGELWPGSVVFGPRGDVVLGLTVSESDEWYNVFESLVKRSGATFGFVGYECPPPETEAEFVSNALGAVYARYVDGVFDRAEGSALLAARTV